MCQQKIPTSMVVAYFYIAIFDSFRTLDIDIYQHVYGYIYKKRVGYGRACAHPSFLGSLTRKIGRFIPPALPIAA
jgi:hypothetical protein